MDCISHPITPFVPRLTPRPSAAVELVAAEAAAGQELRQGDGSAAASAAAARRRRSMPGWHVFFLLWLRGIEKERGWGWAGAVCHDTNRRRYVVAKSTQVQSPR